MGYNGPAIKGDCVPAFSQKSGMAHFLPSLPFVALAKEGLVQILLNITRVALKVLTCEASSGVQG